MMICRRRDVAARRDHRARLPVGQRLEGLPARPARCAASRCRPACARATGCRSRSSRPRPRPRSGHDENIDFDDAWSRWSARPWPSGRATSRWRSTRSRRDRAEAVGHHPGRHQVRVRRASDGERASCCLIDEVLTPDSQPLLGRRDLRAGPRAGVVRQAVRARLARDARLGQDAARAGAAGRRRRGHARPLRRGVRADHRRSASTLPRRRTASPMSSYRFAVSVMPSDGILDPQGRAVESSAAPPRRERRARRARRPARRAHRGGAGRRRGARASSSGWPRSCFANPLIESWEIVGRWSVAGMKVGVVVLPGLQLRPRRAPRRRAWPAPTPSCLWHEDGRPARRRRGHPARRLRLRRLPARRRHRPLQPGHGRGRASTPRRGGRCWASATASRCWPRRACCPARCCATRACASSTAG